MSRGWSTAVGGVMRPLRGTSQDKVTKTNFAIANTFEQFAEVLSS